MSVSMSISISIRGSHRGAGVNLSPPGVSVGRALKQQQWEEMGGATLFVNSIQCNHPIPSLNLHLALCCTLLIYCRPCFCATSNPESHSESHSYCQYTGMVVHLIFCVVHRVGHVFVWVVQVWWWGKSALGWTQVSDRQWSRHSGSFSTRLTPHLPSSYSSSLLFVHIHGLIPSSPFWSEFIVVVCCNILSYPDHLIQHSSLLHGY